MFKIIRKLNYKKIISVVTAACFTFSIFATSGFTSRAFAQNAAPGLQTVNTSPALNPSNFVVPFNIGRVTDSVNFKSDKVIVQIQDLHAHEETQRNIANILSLLDSKYKINKVYVEGAVGGVDTSWLANISDENLKNSIINSLLSKGILTGSELFSVNSGKTKILEGIEDKKAYIENFNRLVKIDSQRDEVRSLFPEIRTILSYLAEQHYGKENKRIEAVVNRYKNGKLSFDKYFSFLVKKAKRQNVYFGFYPSIVLLSDIISVQNKLNKDKVNSQIESFLEEIKSNITYGEYKELIAYSSKPETEGVFYFKLAEFYNKGNYGAKYPELAKFLQFIGFNQTINPLDLVNEERALLWEVRNNAAKTNKERELLFLGNFIDLMEGFLENKITAPEYKYFEKELPKFKALWTKYTRMSELPGLEQYYSLFESFYKVNVERNNIFVKEMSGKLPKTREANMTFSKDMIMTGVAELLANAKEVEVVVTGGFHTQDVSRILQNANQSYVVITPNVTQDAALADKLFVEDVIRISKYIPTNTFQKALPSGAFDLSDKSLKAAVGVYFQKDVLDAAKAVAKAEGKSVAEVINGENSLKDQVRNKGLSGFDIEIIENKDGSYTVTAKADGISGEYTITESGIVDSAPGQAYDVKEAGMLGGIGVFAVAALSALGIVLSFPLAPAIAVFGIVASFIVGLGIASFSAASVYNAGQVQEALISTTPKELTAAQKKTGDDYVAGLEEKYNQKNSRFRKESKKGLRIVNVPGLDVIARTVKGEGGKYVIAVNALALMKLNEDLVDNIILNHELMHVRGLMGIEATKKFEVIAHIANTFSLKNMRSYNFKQKNTAVLNFYKALDEYNAVSVFNPANKMDIIRFVQHIEGKAEALINAIKVLSSYGDINQIFLNDIKVALEDIAVSSPELNETVSKLKTFYGVEEPIAVASSEQEARGGFTSYRSLSKGRLTQQEIENNRINRSIQGKLNEYNIPAEKISILDKTELVQLKAEGLSCTTVLEELLVKAKVVDSYSGPRHIYYIKDNAELKKISDYLSKPENIAHLKLVQAVAHYKEKNEISLGGLKYGVTQFNKKEIYTLKWDAKYARKIESLIDNNKEAFNGTLNRIRNTFEFTDKPSKETTEAFFKAAEEAVSPIAIEMVTTPSISSKMTDEQYKAHLYKTITNRFAELGITISPEDTPSAQTKLIVFHHTEQYNQQSEKYGYIIEKIGDILRGDEIGENRGEDISDDFERTEFFVDMTSTAVLERLDGILNEAEKKFPRPTKVKQILAAALSLVLPEKAVIEEDMTGKATVDDLAEKYGEKFFEGKTVILRADLNVKLEKKDGKVKIIDNNKIKQTAPTIRYLTERGAKVIVITHLADPEADEDENLVFVPEENLYKYDLSPVADEIASLTGKEVKYCEDVIGDNNSSTIKAMNNGDIALLGNLRKKPDIGEKTNSEEFVKKFLNNNFGGNLENIIYVTDAFGTTHRSHASIEKLPEYLKNNGVIVVGGHLMAKELKVLEGVNKNPRSPLLKVLGGSKVTKKMNTVNMSLSQVEKGKVEDLTIIIGGPMAFAFIAYKFGKDKMGGAKIEEGDITFAGKILDKEKELRAQGKKIEIVLPKDFVTIPVGSYNFDAHQFNEGYSKKDILVTETYEVPAGREPMDVGPKTIDEYKKQVERVAQQRGMFLGNGPLGVVEDNENGFDEGTIQFMMAVIEATEDPEKGKEGIISAAGGGETMIGVKKAIKRLLEKFGIKGNLTHGSTGGDAFAQYFEKDGQTPGVKVITSKGELIEPAGSKSGLLETSGVWKKIRNSWWVNGFIRPFTKGNELKVRSLAVAVYEARYIFEMIRKPIKFADRHKLYSDKTKTEILTGTEKLGKDSETAFVTGALGGAIFAAIAAFPISIVFGVLALPVSMLFIGALVCTLVSTVIAIGIISMFYINISGHSKYNYKQLAQAANALGIILDHAKEDVKSKEYASILQYFVGDKSAGNFDLVLEIINNPGKIDEYIEKSNIVKKQDLPLSQQPLAIQIKETLDQMLLLETDSKQASKIKELLRALPENLGKALGLGVEEFLFKQSDLDGTRYTVFQVPENSGIRGEWLTNAIKKYIEDEEEKGKTLELGITNPKRFERSFIIWENMYDSMAMTLANLEAVVGFVNELKNLTDDEVIKQVDRQKAEIVAKMPLNEAKAGRAVGKMLREVVLDPNSKSSKDFLNGGYNQPGWGVAAKAVLNGSFAVDESGNQGYYTEEGKQKFLDDVARKRKFFHDRPKPIKVFIKPGIGGQNTPFKGLADGFKVVVYGGSEMLGEYELGKDYETELNDLLKKMGIGWDQVAVMPSSKSGSTDETMMIYSELLYLQLKYIPATQNINNIDGESFADLVFNTLHDINFIKDDKGNETERTGADLFKIDKETQKRLGTNTNSLITLLVERANAAGLNITRDQVKQIFKVVLGNTFFETTNRVEQSRLAAFLINSGLLDDLGIAPENIIVEMYDNVGGRWTADLHMEDFLALYNLDAEAYWNARNKGIREVNEGTHRSVELAGQIIDNNITDIALVVPDELFWFGKSIEQNFNESIWQERFANVVVIKQSHWQVQQDNYLKEKDAGRMVINLSGQNISSKNFNVQNMQGMTGNIKKLTPKKMVEMYANLTTLFYGITSTVGNRLIARALLEEGYTPADVDLNDLDNPATKIVQENLYLRQPYVELGKGLLEKRLKDLQKEESRKPGAIVNAMESVKVQARAGKLKTSVSGLYVPENIRDMQTLADAIKSAMDYAADNNRKFVPFIYLEGEKFSELRNYLTELGIEWVLQGTGDQHISYQQVLAQPQKYLPFIISFVPEKEQPARRAIGFAKGYLDNVSPNLVRDYFAEASYDALTILRSEQGGQGFFLRLTDSPENISMVKEAAKKAVSSEGILTLDSTRKIVDRFGGIESRTGRIAGAVVELLYLPWMLFNPGRFALAHIKESDSTAKADATKESARYLQNLTVVGASVTTLLGIAIGLLVFSFTLTVPILFVAAISSVITSNFLAHYFINTKIVNDLKKETIEKIITVIEKEKGSDFYLWLTKLISLKGVASDERIAQYIVNNPDILDKNIEGYQYQVSNTIGEILENYKNKLGKSGLLTVGTPADADAPRATDVSRKTPSERMFEIVKNKQTGSDVLASILDEQITQQELKDAKKNLADLINNTTMSLIERQRALIALSEKVNIIKAADASQREVFDWLMVAKSLYAKEVAAQLLADHKGPWKGSELIEAEFGNPDNLQKYLQKEAKFDSLSNMQKFMAGKIESGALKSEKAEDVAKAKKFALEWLDEPRMPMYIKQGIVGAILEGRHDDLIFAFAAGWREFGTAGIRNPAVNSSFRSILLLELELFAQSPYAPILTGHNMIGMPVMLQQTAAIKAIIAALQAYVKAHPDAIEVTLKDLLMPTSLYKRAAAAGKAQGIKDIAISLPKEFKDDILAGNLTFAFDSRMNGKFFAYAQALDVADVANVSMFELVAGVPMAVYSYTLTGALFEFLVSASHSEAFANGFKFFVGQKMSQVDSSFKEMIMAFRNLIEYDDIALELADPNTDIEQKIREHPNKWTWVGDKNAPAGFNNLDSDKRVDFYTGYYAHIEELVVNILGRLNPEQAAKTEKKRKKAKILYSAFSGAGATDAANFVDFLKRMGYDSVDIVKGQTEHVDGRFPAFIVNGWEPIMPDPGNPTGVAISIVDYILENAGADLKNLDKAVRLTNKNEAMIATDPDIDRFSLTINVPAGQGNIKQLLMSGVLKNRMESRGFSQEQIDRVLKVVEKRLNDKLMLTANDAWTMLAYNKLENLKRQNKLKKDKLYVIVKSHVTTSALKDLANHYRALEYPVSCVDTYVGFTLLAERADQLKKFARTAWTARRMLELNDPRATWEQILPLLEEAYEPFKLLQEDNRIPEIDEVMNLARAYKADDDKTELLKQLAQVSNVEFVCGVEESNGYGVFGEIRPKQEQPDDAAVRQLLEKSSNLKTAFVNFGEENLELINTHIQDKDGGLAAALFAELLARLKVHGQSLWGNYLEMCKTIKTVTLTQNDFKKYSGAEGIAKKVAAMQVFEKRFAYWIQRALDKGQAVTFLNGKYKVKGLKIYRDRKYDNNYDAFPEEGVQIIMEREVEIDGKVMKFQLETTFRPSGTGTENKDYNWMVGILPDESANMSDADMAKYLEIGRQVLAEAVKDFYEGLLVKIADSKMDEYSNICKSFFDQQQLVIMSPEEENLAKLAEDYAYAARALKGKIEPQEKAEYDKNLKNMQGKNREAWKKYLDSDEAKAYPAEGTVGFYAGGKEVARVPRAMAVTWTASLADYLALLAPKGTKEVSCEVVMDVAVLAARATGAQVAQAPAGSEKLLSTSKALEAFWDAVARRTVDDEAGEHVAAALWIDRYIGTTSEGERRLKILDLGSGRGNDTDYLLRAGHEVISAELSQAMLDKMHANIPGSKGIKFDMANPADWAQFEDNQFDVINANLSLNYFTETETETILNELKRITKPGGKWYISVNSVKDVGHGAGDGELVEKNFYIDRTRNIPKRFFDADDIQRFFGPFGKLSFQEMQIVYDYVPKVAYEIVVVNEKEAQKDVEDTGALKIVRQEVERLLDIIVAIAKMLGINFKDTYISKNYPSLTGLRDIMVFGTEADEEEAIELAVAKTKLGKNVDVIMPMGRASKQTIASLRVVEHSGSQHLYKRTIEQENGFAVNIYYYPEYLQNSYDAYKHVVDNLDGLVGIVENASDISFNDISVAAPQAAVFAITRNAAEDAQAKDKGYSNFTNGMSEENKLKVAAETQRINREGDDMRNQLPLITNIDVSKIKDANIIDALIATVLSVELTTVADFENNTAALKTFIDKAHAKDKRVTLNFKPANKAEAEAIIKLIANKGLKALRTNWIGVDGVNFDFDSLNKQEFDEIKDSLKNISSVIKRENSGAIISIKSAYYTENIAGIDNYGEYINISGNYNDNTVDTDAIAESARKAITSGAKALVIDYEVLELLATRGINIDVYSLFLGIVSAWTSYVKRTPEGIYRNARRSGFRETVSVTTAQEDWLYYELKKLNEGDKSAIKAVAEALNTSKANTLQTIEEAQGYVQGILEKLLLDRFGEKTFAYKTNADVYRTALVMAKINGLSDDEIRQSLDNKKDAREVLGKYDISTENLKTAQVEEASQEAINAIISDLEDNKVESKNRPQAIADLLFMLGIVKTTKLEVEHAKADKQQEGIRAILAAA